MKEKKLIPRSVGTHDGSFHADEVTACALLVLFDLVDPDKIHRTRDPVALSQCEYICDVGGVYDPNQKKFDHHQVDYVGSLSSAGMILQYLRDEKIIDQELYDYFNRSLIMGVDAHDNGAAKLEIGFCSFSQVVSNFLPINYDASLHEVHEAFLEAFHFVLGHLTRLRERYFYTASCKEKVAQCMKESEDVLIFEEQIPWLENFFALEGEKHPARFVVMPSGSHWKLRGIPPNLKERMSVRQPLPKKWAGLHDQDLQKASGITGAVFCHKGRFISIWKTKQDALKALEFALKEEP